MQSIRDDEVQKIVANRHNSSNYVQHLAEVC